MASSAIPNSPRRSLTRTKSSHAQLSGITVRSQSQTGERRDGEHDYPLHRHCERSAAIHPLEMDCRLR